MDAYYNLVKDKIVAYPKGQQFRWTMLNLGKVDIRGVDVQATATFRLPLEIGLMTKVQYTYQEAIDITNPATTTTATRYPISLAQRLGHSGLTYKDWGLNYSFVYVGERYNQQENIEYNYVQPWYTSDISLVKSFKIKAVNLKVTAEVNNLFDQAYDVVLNFPHADA